MTQYIYQTDTTKVIGGELGVNSSGQLVAGNGAEGSVEVVGNPSNSTAVVSVNQTYAEDVMDISNAVTLGSGFVFLNGSGFDAAGLGSFEFEESNGVTYGLYGRTDGLGQQVYLSGAQNNQLSQQYTTVPYVPPFLNGNQWQASAVIGSDLQGFVLQLRDSSMAGSTSSPRFIYVRINGSLIDTSGHTYVEITAPIQNYISSVTSTAGTVPRVVKIGDFFFIAYGDWIVSSLWFGGWNAPESSLGLTNAALPATAPGLTQTLLSISTQNWPGGDTTNQQFPILMGGQAPGGLSNFKTYNMNTGAVNDVQFLNAPNPISAGWTTNLPALLDGDVDPSGNYRMVLGCGAGVGDVTGNTNTFIAYTITPTFSGGSAGAYTNALLTFNVGGTNGSDLHYAQPSTPFYIGIGTFNAALDGIPNETVVADPGTPSTCVNKLPIASYYTGYGIEYGGNTQYNWLYSGNVSIVSTANSTITRAVTKPSAYGGGTMAAAKANKLGTLWPMFNVNPRMNFGITGAPSVRATVSTSGQLVTHQSMYMVAPDTMFAVGVNAQGNNQYAVMKFPANSQIGDTVYNRFGSSVPGFSGRIAEYATNLPGPDSTLSNWGCVWTAGIADVKSPLNVVWPAISDNTGFTPANRGIRVGSWTLSGTTYQAPPNVWTYSSTMNSDMETVRAAALAAAQAQYPSTTGVDMGVEIVPIMNASGTGPAFALGLLWSRTGTTNLQATFFTTPCSISGTTVSLTNPSSVTTIYQRVTPTFGILGIPGSSDYIGGRIYAVYSADGTTINIGWQNANAVSLTGDSLVAVMFAQMSAAGVPSSINATLRSNSRAPLSCGAQHNGLAIFLYRQGVTFPTIEYPVSRYSTSTITSQNDFSASFTAAIANPDNVIPNSSDSYNVTEFLAMSSINSQFLLQIGSISGRLNHKQYSLPATFLDLTSAAVGTYYLYITDTGAGGVQLQYDTAQRAETATSMYFGKFDRTSTGFANESSISEVIRFGTARLVAGTSGTSLQGSQIRIGGYTA